MDEKGSGCLVYSLVDPFAVREPFFEVDKRRILVEALEQGDGSDLGVNPDRG